MIIIVIIIMHVAQCSEQQATTTYKDRRICNREHAETERKIETWTYREDRAKGSMGTIAKYHTVIWQRSMHAN